jgi:hypothetical protein
VLSVRKSAIVRTAKIVSLPARSKMKSVLPAPKCDGGRLAPGRGGGSGERGAGPRRFPGGRAGRGAPRGRGETHCPGSAACCVAALRLCACAAVWLATHPADMAVGVSVGYMAVGCPLDICPLGGRVGARVGVVEKSFKIRRMQHRTSKGPGPANRPNKASNRVSSPGLGPLRS